MRFLAMVFLGVAVLAAPAWAQWSFDPEGLVTTSGTGAITSLQKGMSLYTRWCIDDNDAGGPPQTTGPADGFCDEDGTTAIESGGFATGARAITITAPLYSVHCWIDTGGSGTDVPTAVVDDCPVSATAGTEAGCAVEGPLADPWTWTDCRTTAGTCRGWDGEANRIVIVSTGITDTTILTCRVKGRE